MRMKKILLIPVALFLFISCETNKTNKKPSELYSELQKSTATGWNTWNTNSVLSHVLLPEGLAVSIGIKNSWKNGDQYLNKAFKTSKAIKRPEEVKLGIRSDDGFYTELNLKWNKADINVQSATDDGDLILLISTNKIDTNCIYHLIIETGMLWSKPGKVYKEGEKIIAEVSGKQYEISSTSPLIEDPYIPISSPYLAIALNGQIAIYTGNSRTLKDVKKIINEHKKIIEQRFRKYENLSEAFKAMQTTLAWNVIFDPGNNRVISPVSRMWNYSWSNGFVMFNWDTYFASEMYSFYNKDLAYINAIEITKSYSDSGFVPNYASTYGRKSNDRSQPPVGSMIINSIYKKYKEKWLLEYVYDDLLRWNRWWIKHRDNQGYLCWGSDSVFYPSISDGEHHTWQAAAWESGLDNSPQFDHVPFNKKTNMLELADVGLMSLYIMDCNELAEIAAILGKTEDADELKNRSSFYGKNLNTLWNEEKGIFLNKRTDNGKISYRISPTNFYPLLAKVATQQQAERMMKEHYFNPDVFYGEYVIPSIARNDSAFKDQDYWRGRIWAPLNYLVYLGICNYNLPEARKDLVQRSLNLIMKSWNEKGAVCENYNGIDGGFEDKKNCDNFYHWGALLGYISFLEENNYKQK